MTRFREGILEPDEADCYDNEKTIPLPIIVIKEKKMALTSYVFMLGLTSSPVTDVQTALGSACCNALMT